MELLWKDGDYVPDGAGGFQRAEGEQALLQRVLFLLTARRGQFPLLPELGSRLFRLPGQKASLRESLAKEYVAEALAGENDLAVTDTTLNQKDGRGMLTVSLTYEGEPFQVTVGVEGW